MKYLHDRRKQAHQKLMPKLICVILITLKFSHPDDAADNADTVVITIPLDFSFEKADQLERIPEKFSQTVFLPFQ